MLFRLAKSFLMILFTVTCLADSSFARRGDIISLTRNEDGTFRAVCEKKSSGGSYIQDRVPRDIVETSLEDKVCNGVDIHLNRKFEMGIPGHYPIVAWFSLASENEGEGYDLSLRDWHSGERITPIITKHSTTEYARHTGAYHFSFDVEYLFYPGFPTAECVRKLGDSCVGIGKITVEFIPFDPVLHLRYPQYNPRENMSRICVAFFGWDYSPVCKTSPLHEIVLQQNAENTPLSSGTK